MAEWLSTVMSCLALFGFPLAVMIWFVVSLVQFLKTPKEDEKLRKQRRTELIISGVLTAILAVAIIALMILVMMAISHM